jgi:hypothetical protein
LFEDKMIAGAISGVMLDTGKTLNASLTQVQENCSAAEFERYRRIVARIMGEILVEVMNPIYATHPELKPDELK